MKAALIGILKDHPQALYYSLRSFYLDRRDIESRSKGQKATSSNEDDTQSSSRFAEEMMSNLRKTHPVLWSKLEAILEELIMRFRPSYESELLHSINAILYKTSRASGSLADTMDACTKTLHMLGTKFFNLNKERPESSITRKAALFHARYTSMFKSDFIEEGACADRDDLVAKLQKWKTLLEKGLSRFPKTSSLQEVPRKLFSKLHTTLMSAFVSPSLCAFSIPVLVGITGSGSLGWIM